MGAAAPAALDSSAAFASCARADTCSYSVGLWGLLVVQCMCVIPLYVHNRHHMVLLAGAPCVHTRDTRYTDVTIPSRDIHDRDQYHELPAPTRASTSAHSARLSSECAPLVVIRRSSVLSLFHTAARAQHHTVFHGRRRQHSTWDRPHTRAAAHSLERLHQLSSRAANALDDQPHTQQSAAQCLAV